MMKNIAKKVLTVSMAAIITAASAAVNVSAKNDLSRSSDYGNSDISNLGSVEFMLNCSYADGLAYASTDVVSKYEQDSLSAYVSLELYGVTGGRGYEFIDEESSEENNTSSKNAYADVVLFAENVGSYVELSASSYHEGSIGDSSVSDYFSVND